MTTPPYAVQRLEALAKPSGDPVENPPHYTRFPIQPKDFILKNDLDWATGNVIKYVVRAPHKGKHLQDLEKARNMIDLLIEQFHEENA